MKMPLSFLLLGLALLQPGLPAAAQALPGDSLYQLDAKVTDQDGNAGQWRELRGKPRIVSMFYTNCHLMCPLIIENGKAVQKQLTPAERARVELVMISLDPARDTPQALRETAQRHRVPAQWRFLQPGANDARAIASVLDVRYRPREDGSINHTSVLVLVDADGRVLARSEVASAIPDPAFVAAVRTALSASASPVH